MVSTAFAVKTFIAALMFLALLAGSIWLQIFLSKKRNKWLGLIIPFICFMLSILPVLSLVMYSAEPDVTLVIENGVKTYEKATVSPRPVIHSAEEMFSMIGMIVPVFLVANIPTVIFLAIYFACRESIKSRAELDKMNIQDLE